jgi:hypothetical protein
MGIIEHAKSASTVKQIEDIRAKLSQYRYASKKTVARVNRLLAQANKNIKG